MPVDGGYPGEIGSKERKYKWVSRGRENKRCGYKMHKGLNWIEKGIR
jgi:hypothetical protein